MTPKQTREFFQFLAGYWYDRSESDSEVIGEIIAELSPDYLGIKIELLKMLVADEKPDELKSDFIRKCVWQHIPSGSKAPIDWLKDILFKLQKAASTR